MRQQSRFDVSVNDSHQTGRALKERNRKPDPINQRFRTKKLSCRAKNLEA